MHCQSSPSTRQGLSRYLGGGRDLNVNLDASGQECAGWAVASSSELREPCDANELDGHLCCLCNGFHELHLLLLIKLAGGVGQLDLWGGKDAVASVGVGYVEHRTQECNEHRTGNGA